MVCAVSPLPKIDRLGGLRQMALRTFSEVKNQRHSEDPQGGVMRALCVDQQIVLDFVNVSISGNVSPWTKRTQGNANRKSILCAFTATSCHRAPENRVRSGGRMVGGEVRLNKTISEHTDLRHHILCARASFSCIFQTNHRFHYAFSPT